MKTMYLLLIVTSASLLLAQQETVISGKLLGSDGKQMLKAHVRLSLPNVITSINPIKSVEVGKEGTFSMAFNDTGILVLHCTGVDHRSHDVALDIHQPLTLKVNVQLSRSNFPDGLSEVRIDTYSNLNGYSTDPMEKQPDGKFAAEFKTQDEQFKYRIFAFPDFKYFSVTQSEDFEYDGREGYRSIVTPKDGKVRIVLDPKKLIRSDAEATIRFENAPLNVVNFAAIYSDLQKRREEWREARSNYKKSGKDMKDFQFDWTSYITTITARLKQEQDPTLRRLLYFSYLDPIGWCHRNVGQDEQQLVKEAIYGIGPESPVWALGPLSIGESFKNCDDKDWEKTYWKYVDQVLEKNPDENLRASLLLGIVYDLKDGEDQEHFKKYYNVLITKYGDTEYGKEAKEEINPEQKLLVGKTIPNFSFVSMDNPKETFTNEFFRGKIYLIDFWATWCPPCVREMEDLHKTYENFKSKGFDILSLSGDVEPEKVIKFRQEKWKMPWHNVFIEKSIEDEITKEFEVDGFPTLILVNGNTGEILALGTYLRGEKLGQTLAKFLREGK